MPPRAPSRLTWALIVSLLIHLAVLFVQRQNPAAVAGSPPLMASLRAPVKPQAVPEPTPMPAPPKTSARSQKPSAQQRILTVPKSSRSTTAPAPKWSVAERAEMNQFLDGLEAEAKATPKPTLAQRSMAMARDMGRQMARQDEHEMAVLEMRPDAPPPNPFSLELYVEGLIRRLNRSAAFVKNDPRTKGVKPALLQFKLNPDGTLKSMTVLNEGDQAEEIAFVKQVVRQSIPFAPFPNDLDRAARSLTMNVCIQPRGIGGGGFGFSRSEPGRGC